MGIIYSFMEVINESLTKEPFDYGKFIDVLVEVINETLHTDCKDELKIMFPLEYIDPIEVKNRAREQLGLNIKD